MRIAWIACLVAGCYREAPPPAAPKATDDEAPPPARVVPMRKPIAALTPSVVYGAVLGQPFAALRSGRPNIVRDSERYDFRDHYAESLNLDGVDSAHYYTMPNEGVMYQISLDFTESGKAEAMWQPYTQLGTVIDDLGGKEVVIDGYPFQVRVWVGDKRLQLMAVIEGTEWWSQYHPDDTDDGGGGDDDVDY